MSSPTPRVVSNGSSPGCHIDLLKSIRDQGKFGVLLE